MEIKSSLNVGYARPTPASRQQETAAPAGGALDRARTLAAGTAVATVPQEDARLPPYLSPVVKYDQLGRVPIVAYRDSATGEVKEQIPPERVVEEYRRNAIRSAAVLPKREASTTQGMTGQGMTGGGPARQGTDAATPAGNDGTSSVAGEAGGTGTSGTGTRPAVGPKTAGSGADTGGAPSGVRVAGTGPGVGVGVAAAPVAPVARVSMTV